MFDLPELSEEQVSGALEQLQTEFPGAWEKLLRAKRTPVPDNELDELKRALDEALASIWTVILNIDFIRHVESEDERASLSHALFLEIMNCADAQVNQAKQ